MQPGPRQAALAMPGTSASSIASSSARLGKPYESPIT
jgi:hypothetical protein